MSVKVSLAFMLHRRTYRREGEGYPSDLRESEWARLEPLIPGATLGGRPRKSVAESCRGEVAPRAAGAQQVKNGVHRRPGLREPCRNPGHLRYPRLHPTGSQAACQ